MNAPPPAPYVMLHAGSQRTPPPYHRNVPRYNSTYGKKAGGCSCFRCICSFCIFLFLLVLILASLAFCFYLFYQPQIPSYKVDNLEVKSMDMEPDFSLRSEFVVTVKAVNPNTIIGFIYGKDSSVHVVYSSSDLCSGMLPSFYQGAQNTTLMKVDLVGKYKFGSGLQEAFAESRENHEIPLLVKVKVPVKVVVAGFPLRQFIVLVNYSLVVDDLSPNKKIGILSSNTTFDIEF